MHLYEGKPINLSQIHCEPVTVGRAQVISPTHSIPKPLLATRGIFQVFLENLHLFMFFHEFFSWIKISAGFFFQKFKHSPACCLQPGYPNVVAMDTWQRLEKLNLPTKPNESFPEARASGETHKDVVKKLMGNPWDWWLVRYIYLHESLIFTPLKTNMSPENQWLEDEFPI